MLRPTFTDKIAFLYSSNASSFGSLVSGDAFSFAEESVLLDTPLVDRTPALSRDERMLAILADGLGIGVILAVEFGKIEWAGSALMVSVVIGAALSI